MATLWSLCHIYGFGISTQPRPDTEFGQTGTIDIRAYYIRRVSRIIPLYCVAIIIFAVAQKDTHHRCFLGCKLCLIPAQRQGDRARWQVNGISACLQSSGA